jgi:branched-chain amino acid aminotransferase
MDCHVDGELVPESRALSVHDRGFRYGDAAVETLRARAGEPFRWEQHRERLDASCSLLGIDPPPDLRERVRETLKANDLARAVVRVSVTRGDGGAGNGLTPPPNAEPWAVVVTEPLESVGAASLQTVKRRLTPDRSVPVAASTHNRLDRVLARRELASGADEALLLDGEGSVVGGAGSTLFFVDGGTLRAPNEDRSAPVFGSFVADLAAEEGFQVERDRFPPDDVRGAEEALLASPRWGVRPVERVDGIGVESGPLTALLSRLVEERLNRPETGE